jgi:CubicO group peptidase (beta-lactamase class C family)
MIETPKRESDVRTLAAVASDLESIAAEFVVDNALPGVSVGAVLDGELAWTVNIGSADLETGRAPDERTLYRIASITKTFTATAIVQLRDDGLLDLDDPLVRHLPEFRAAHNPFGPIEQVTLLRLLRHTAGLQGENPSDDPWEWALLTPAEVLSALDRVKVVISPDTANKYSNLGYHLLGEVVRRVGGRDYGDYLRDEILEPLEMAATTLDPGVELAARCARGYDRRDTADALRPARTIGPDRTEGAGGLWSCVDDLARWVAQQLRTGPELIRGPGQVLAGRSLDEMQRPAFVAEPDLLTAQGLGWRMVRRGETILVGHGGFLFGFTSRVDFSPADRFGIVALANGVSNGRPLGDLAWALAERALPEIRRQETRSRADRPRHRTPEAWSALLGRYLDSVDHAGTARVEDRDGRLVYVDEDDGKIFDLRATDDPLVFVFEDGRAAGEPLRFLTDDRGRIVGLNAAGYPMVRHIPARPDDWAG